MTFWHENGQKEGEENYKDGKKNGLCTYWDEDGNLTGTKTYKDGVEVQ
ncbi:MAG: hypothetical protein NZ729_02470 [Methylococcales bacterium]|nr:hypothetical protein [Methylococcales bacterium]